MIYTQRNVVIKNDTATIDNPILLYRGDREVEIQFTIVDSKFRFQSSKGNIIDNTQASYGQLAIVLPDNTDLLSDIAETQDGVVILNITGEMIDEIHEVGFYSFQIRLYNDDKTSRITLPPVMEGIEIREPLVIEDAIADISMVGYSSIQIYGTEEPAFDEDGNYIKTDWQTGDKITASKLNKIEETLETINNDIPSKTSELVNDSNFLSSIPSEYVTDNELNAKGYLTEHQDISNKVDKESGKGLSTNDYTTEEKNKLAGIQAGANKVTVYKADECTTFTSDDGTCTPAAVQKAVKTFPPKEHEHSQYLTQHQDISHLANKSDIPTATSQLANDNGFITIAHEHARPQPGNFFVNGYAGMTADGVMECGKYQDWHNADDETKDFSLRVQLDHSNGNTVLWPTAGGRLALQSDIDAKITEHVNSNRITFRAGVGSTDRYYPLFKLEADGASNYGNVILKGRIGGWEQGNSAVYDITLLNRSSARDGRTITAMVSMQGDHTQSYQRADIVIYRQDDTSAIVYLKANSYALWDFEYTLLQHTRLYDESYVTTPTGELVWQLSTAPKTHLSSTGTFSVGSSPSGLKELATKEYVDNKAISGGGGSDGTDHNHDNRYYTESESNSRFYGNSVGKINIDTSYNGQLLMIQNGSNLPCTSQYGVVVNMPYRKLTGNSKTDFMGQILLPNGDDDTHPNSMFYRTSLGDTWNKWQEVNTRQTKTYTLPATAGWYRIAEAPVGNVNGRIKLKAENGNYACCSILDAVITKNKYPSLIPVAHSIYSSNSLSITQARIAYVSGSATEKSYLEVYVSPNVALTMTVTSENCDWQLIDPIAVEESPSGYGLFSCSMSYNINGYAKRDHTHHKVTAMSFDSSGYLSITIDGVTKRFAPV